MRWLRSNPRFSRFFSRNPIGKKIFGYLEIFFETFGRFVTGKQIRCAVHLLSEVLLKELGRKMRKKLSAKDFERLIDVWGFLERLSRVDLGTYYPIVTLTGENPFALAFRSPASPVSARLETPQGPVDLRLIWTPKVKKPRDLWAEQERRLSASGSLAATGKHDSGNKKKKPEDQDDLGVERSELDSQGNFELTVQNAPEGFELQDIRFVKEGSDDQPVTPVMGTGEVVIPDSDCDAAIKSLDAKVQGRVTHQGASRDPHKQASSDEDGQEEGGSYTQSNDEAHLLTPEELLALYLKFYKAIIRRLRLLFGSDCEGVSLDDVMQNFYIELLRLKSFENRGECANFWYLMKLARWCYLDQYRKTIRRSMKSLDTSYDKNDSASTTLAELVQVHEDSALRDALIETVQLERLRSAIPKLPKEQLDLLIATQVEGRSQKDIAETMGISVKAVKSRVMRAKTALRELFESEPD
jgi:RNA polymerase sigma factor (sigma-70 family)